MNNMYYIMHTPSQTKIWNICCGRSTDYITKMCIYVTTTRVYVTGYVVLEVRVKMFKIAITFPDFSLILRVT